MSEDPRREKGSRRREPGVPMHRATKRGRDGEGQSRKGWLRRGALALGVLGAALTYACAVNPATGERQLSLISESEEIQMGREFHPQVVSSFGMYPDSSLQEYVRLLGLRMAQRSERPNLPWTFTVVDDPVVNAFAVPGGFIYMTRGILAHFSSEAQLASVLGHEIGHITARHSVNQMSRARLAQTGLGLGSVLAGPQAYPLVNLAGASLQLLFLEFGRDDERQSDDLGYRYMTSVGYDPTEMVEVFEMLGSVSAASGAERVPSWLSTHPDPENRESRILERIAADTSRDEGGRVGQEAYLRRIDGLVYGEDPRQGFFQENAFYHPELTFRMTFPSGWNTVNQRDVVAAISPEEDAIVQLALEEEIGSPDQARRRFFSQDGITADEVSNQEVNGLEASWAAFRAQDQRGNEIRGQALFVRLDDVIYRIMGFAPGGRWEARRAAIESTLRSFERETRDEVLEVEAARIEIVELEERLSFREFLDRYPSSIEPSRAALLNQVEEGATLEPGLYKRVVGGELPEL